MPEKRNKTKSLSRRKKGKQSQKNMEYSKHRRMFVRYGLLTISSILVVYFGFSSLAGTEILKPSVHDDVAGNTTLHEGAYDSSSANDLSTSSSIVIANNSTPSILYYGFASATHENDSMSLNMVYSATGLEDDTYEVSYSTSGEVDCSDYASRTWVSLVSETSDVASDQLSTTSLSPAQDLSTVCVRVSTDKVAAPDDAELSISDIWVAGEFSIVESTGSVTVPTSISQANDGSGFVTFDTTISSNDDSVVKVLYSDDGGSSWYDAQLEAVTPSSGSIDLDNASEYQIGANDMVDTHSGDVTLTVVWDTLSLSNGNGSMDTRDEDVRLIVIVSDGSNDFGNQESADFVIDNAEPAGLALETDDGLQDTPPTQILDVTIDAEELQTEFYFELATVNDFSTMYDASGWTTDSSWQPDVKNRKTYYWRVKTRDAFGNESEYSEIRSYRTRPGKKFVNVPANIQVISSTNDQVNFEIDETEVVEEVYVKDENGVVIGKLDADFATATEDISLAGVIADVDLENKKAVLHDDLWDENLAATRTLYVPSTGEGAVAVCPGAASLEEVSDICPDKVVISVGDTIDGMTVYAVTIDDQNFYEISGVTGTGAAEVFASVSSASLNYTLTAGDDRILLVNTSTEFGHDKRVTGVTINGGSNVGTLIHVEEETDGGGHTLEMWRVMESDLPASGVISVGVTWNGALTPGIAVIQLDDRDQSAPEAQNASTCLSCTTISTNITTLTDNAIIVTSVGAGHTGSFTSHGPGQVEEWDHVPSSAIHSGTTELIASAGAQTQTETASASQNRQVHIVAAFAPASGGGGGGGGGGSEAVYESFSVNSTSNNQTTVTVTKPTGVVEDDLMVAIFSKDLDEATLLAPAGWTALFNTIATEEESGNSFRVFYKLAGSSEPANYTFTSSGDSDQLIAGIIRFSGVDTADPIDVTSTKTGNNNSPLAPSVTTTSDNATVLRVFGADDDDITVDSGYPSGTTGVFVRGSTGDSGETSIGAAYTTQSSAGSTGTASFSMNASEEWATATIAINPAIDDTSPVGLAALVAGTKTTTTQDLSWSEVTEDNFNHYEVWYGTEQTNVQNRTGTATEWDDSDDSNLITKATTSTTISGLTENTTYYYKIWAIDDSANEETVADISITTNASNSAPAATAPSSISQSTDASGYITFSTTISDTDTDDTKLKVEYSNDGGSSWYDAELISATPDSGTISLNNAGAYQIGDTDAIDTSAASVAMTIVWDTKSASNGNGTLDATDQSDLQVRVTANDSTIDGSASASTNFSLDNLSPVTSEVTPVAGSTSDTTPDYTFTIDEAGDITYGGSCSSVTSSATSGSNTITFNALVESTYSDCTVTIVDSFSNSSNVLAISSFTIDTSAPVISEITPVADLANDPTPDYTFTTNEAGEVSYGGSCSSSTSSATSGNNTVTFNYLTEGTYSDCTITVTDGASSISNVLAITAFAVDTIAPVLGEITPVPDPTTDTTPDYTFSADEAGTISYGGSCLSVTTVAISGNNTVTFSTLSEGTYVDCTVAVTDGAGNSSGSLAVSTFTVDATAPIVSEVTPVLDPTNDTTPDYTFNADEVGDITYGGSCSSATSSATSGNNTITFDTLTEGTYSDCTIKVTDTALNGSNVLAVTAFTIDTTAPVVTESLPVASPTSDNTPSYTINADEAGNISYGGSCDSSTTAASLGSNVITLNTLSDGTSSDCTLTITDDAGNTSTPLAISSFTVDTTPPAIVSITAVGDPTNDNTPEYEFSSNESGTIIYGGSCSSVTTSAVAATNTVSFDSLSDGTYSDCTVHVSDAVGNNSNILAVSSFEVDTTAPVLNEESAIANPTNDTTPEFTFSSTEVSAISYGGSCSSPTTSATLGSNTITLNSLIEGTYSDCTLTITDSASNSSNILAVTSFTIDTTAPLVAEVTPVPVDARSSEIEYVFSSNEAGLIAYDGSCSGDTLSALAGNNTILFVGLPTGEYSDCTIFVTDAAGNQSLNINVSSFEVTSSRRRQLIQPSGTVSINNGESVTDSREVLVKLDYLEATEVVISENPMFHGASFQPAELEVSFTLSDGAGEKTIYAVFKGEGGISIRSEDSVSYEYNIVTADPEVAVNPEEEAEQDPVEVVEEKTPRSLAIATCELDCSEVDYNLYIVNPDGTKRTMKTNFVQVASSGSTSKIIKFEDKGGDMDFNDLWLKVDRSICDEVAVSGLQVDARWHHEVRLELSYQGVPKKDVQLWSDSHESVNQMKRINVQNFPDMCEVTATEKVKQVGVIVYEHINFTGKAHIYAPTSDTSDLAETLMNNTVSSIKLFGGAFVRLFQDTLFGGLSQLFTKDDSDLRDDSIGNDTVSSLQVFEPEVSVAQEDSSSDNLTICVADGEFTQFMTNGTQGAEVMALQELLQCLEFFPDDIEPNGLFGPTTIDSVADFQEDHDIAPVGFVGPSTRDVLNQFSKVSP